MAKNNLSFHSVVYKKDHQPKALNITSIEYAELMQLGWTDIFDGTLKQCQDYIEENYPEPEED